MSENIIQEDPSKILLCHFDSEFFRANPDLIKPFRITLDRMINHYFFNKYEIENLQYSYEQLPKKYIEKLPFDYKDKIEKMKKGIILNEEVLAKMASIYFPKFDFLKIPEEDYKKDYSEEFLEIGMFFYNSLIRDWTDEFNQERERNYGRVLEEIKKYYNYDDEKLDKKDIKILVPGTGCSRMAFEVAKKGFDIELNDLSFLYTFSCDYLFNHSHKYEFDFSPKVYSFNFSYSEESTLYRYKLPNVDIKDELKKAGAKQINFIKGDFKKNYKGKKDLFNCIITIFFIDSSENVLELVEIMYECLKKGGIWINLGTLDFYKWESCESIDLPWDELKQVILNTGFEIKNEETGFTPYGVKRGETISYTHGTVFFTVQK